MKTKDKKVVWKVTNFTWINGIYLNNNKDVNQEHDTYSNRQDNVNNDFFSKIVSVSISGVPFNLDSMKNKPNSNCNLNYNGEEENQIKEMVLLYAGVISKCSWILATAKIKTYGLSTWQNDKNKL